MSSCGSIACLIFLSPKKVLQNVFAHFVGKRCAQRERGRDKVLRSKGRGLFIVYDWPSKNKLDVLLKE